jgi:hypothetical protein
MKYDSLPSDDQILRLIEGWVDLLSCQEYEAAFKLTGHDPYYEWSPELIRKVIEGYGLPEQHPSGNTFRVTNRTAAKGLGPRYSVDRENNKWPTVATAYYELPLNGEWSDLSVTFGIMALIEGYQIVLEEIHVF